MIVAILLAAEVARLTTASEFSETRTQVASRIAPLSPDTLISTAMAQVGETAAQGGDLQPDTLDRLRLLAAVAPLRPEPYLVEAALAQRAGNLARAELLVDQARSRAPRSAAARYLMADIWLRQGKVIEALREMAVLGRLFPDTSVQLVPALAQYARTPGARENLAGMLEENPQLKRPLLDALAADPDNAGLIVALAGPDIRSGDAQAQLWQSRLLLGLIERGDYEPAYSLWRQFAGLDEGPRPFLFNGSFEPLTAPPPFNWRFSSSKAGLAEPDNGKLRVLYFGRADTPLASQLLLLSPGTYRFEAPIGGQLAPAALAWTVRCAAARNPLMELRLGGSATAAASFTVPASGCGAQWLELKGQLQDMPQESDVRIGPASIERVAA